MDKKTTLQRYGGKSTAIGQVRGTGTAHHGAGDWLLMRYTSAGSLLLCLYVVFSLILLPDLTYASMREWVSKPVTATALALMIITVFWHTRQGVAEMIGDYVHESGNKFAAMLALNVAIIGGMAFGLICIARLAFGGAA